MSSPLLRRATSAAAEGGAGGADEDGGGLGRGEGRGRKIDFQRGYAPYVRKAEELCTYSSKGGGVQIVTPLEPRSPNGPVDPAGMPFFPPLSVARRAGALVCVYVRVCAHTRSCVPKPRGLRLTWE